MKHAVYTSADIYARADIDFPKFKCAATRDKMLDIFARPGD